MSRPDPSTTYSIANPGGIPLNEVTAFLGFVRSTGVPADAAMSIDVNSSNEPTFIRVYGISRKEA